MKFVTLRNCVRLCKSVLRIQQGRLAMFKHEISLKFSFLCRRGEMKTLEFVLARESLTVLSA